jgi:hypothetical protein
MSAPVLVGVASASSNVAGGFMVKLARCGWPELDLPSDRSVLLAS